MNQSIEYYKGASEILAQGEKEGARTLIRELIADLEEQKNRTKALEKIIEESEVAFRLADEAALSDFTSRSYVKGVNNKIQYMNADCRQWLIQRPHLLPGIDLTIGAEFKNGITTQILMPIESWAKEEEEA